MNAIFTVFCCVTAPGDADRAFALVHVPAVVRARVATLWQLDARLGAIVAATTQPMVGQLRLTWWHEALTALPDAPVGEPLLAALTDVVAAGIAGHELARLVEGWEVLLDPLPLPDDVLLAYAGARGATVFALTSRLMGGIVSDTVGTGWALADFARRCSDVETAARSFVLARERLDRIAGPRALRVLARLARADAAAGKLLPRRWWRLLDAAC